ncbi:hypothetical protein SF123566_2970, partial [Shigella flexneri 1235-66]
NGSQNVLQLNLFLHKRPKSRLFCPLLKPLNALRSGIIYA